MSGGTTPCYFYGGKDLIAFDGGKEDVSGTTSPSKNLGEVPYEGRWVSGPLGLDGENDTFLEPHRRVRDV